ncbi:MAG: hypothetical protein ABII00_17310 [Elusimicrobiota bacterium]
MRRALGSGAVILAAVAAVAVSAPGAARAASLPPDQVPSQGAGAAGLWGASFRASGYLKNLYRYTRSALTGAPYWSDLTRARLSLDAEMAPAEPPDAWSPPERSLRVHVDYDHELRAGSFLKSSDFRLFGLGEPESYLTMEQAVSSGTDAHYRHLSYRGWVELRSGPWSARFGRQRVAWGAGKIWNPIDVLNPYRPTSLEREERPGVDAALLRRGIGALGQAEAVYALAGRWAESDLLGRVRGNPGGVDLSLLGGKVASSTASWMLGGDFAADVRGGTLHGEWSYTDLRVRTPYWRALLGYEYSFGADPPLRWLKDLWFVTEVLHNGRGRTEPRRYDFTALAGGREVSVARDYWGAGLRKELHPLVQVELYHILNLNDESHFISPSISWNAVGNLHLLAGWQRFGGSPASEYGRRANIAYAQAQYFF